MKTAKLLIVGSSGYIGSQIIARLGLQNVIATYNNTYVEGGVPFDICTMRLADKLLRGSHGISHAILLQGITNIERCAHDPHGTSRINVENTIRAIDDLLDASVKPIFVSSDAVFDGALGDRTEEDPVCPILTYGRQKVLVENHFLKIPTPWAIVRISKVIGSHLSPRNILSDWLESIKSGRILRCATDQVLSPIDVDDVASALVAFVQLDLNGLFHVSGSTKLSRHDLMQLLLACAPKRFSRYARIEACSIDDFTFAERRPKNCSLSNCKFLSASGMKLRQLESTCRHLAAQFFGEQQNCSVQTERSPLSIS
jgi:dTDP-4-dehydrorhamnose reductase